MNSTRKTLRTILNCSLATVLAAPLALAGGTEVRFRDPATDSNEVRSRGTKQDRIPAPDPRIALDAQLEMLNADGRVTDGVMETLVAVADDTQPTIELTLTYDGQLDSSMWTMIEDLGGEVMQVFGTIPGCSVRIPADRVDELLADESIQQIDWNAPVQFSMDVARTAAQASDPQTSGQHGSTGQLNGGGVTIALVDSGVRTHPDLGNLAGCVDLISNPLTNSEDPYQSTAMLAGTLADCTPLSDPFGHGTHIAGILIGDGGRSNELYAGIAPDADLISVRVLDHEGMADVADVITGIDWVVQNKDAYEIDILSLSLGGPFYVPAADDPLVQAVEAAWDAGIVVVVSAGNLGTYGNFTITRPGNSPKVITVGSLTDWNSLVLPDDMKSSYSSMSPTLIDGYLKPDLVAPGNRIISTRAPGSTLDELLEPMGAVFANHYLEMSGTSMAAPIVAATAALMLENEPNLNPDTIKARLMLTADPLPGNALEHGAGRVDIAGALSDTSLTAVAHSPRVLRAAVCCDLYVEDMNGKWGAIWDASALWGDSTLWSDTTLWGETTIWGDTTLWGETTIWGDSTLWADSVVIGE